MFAVVFDAVEGGPSCLLLNDGTTFEGTIEGDQKAIILCDSNIRRHRWRYLNFHLRFEEPTVEELDGLSEREQLASRVLAAGGQRWRPGKLKEAKLFPGQYHLRIWRGLYELGNPLLQSHESAPGATHEGAFLGSVVASGSLFDQVRGAFRYVEPHPRNIDAYGHRLRELLILLCTEVEAA